MKKLLIVFLIAITLLLSACKNKEHIDLPRAEVKQEIQTEKM